MQWLQLLALFSVAAVSTQLGKSDRKAKQEAKRAKEEKDQEGREAEQQFPLIHPSSSITKQSILKNHENVDYSERKFDNPMLVYVTPWNSKGYDLAKWLSHKVTHVSPVWIQVKPHVADRSFSCQILGTHDIDHEWMDEVRKNNSDVKIVPRILFDSWETAAITAFFQNDVWMNRCLTDIINLLKRSKVDGAVLELWANAMVQTGGEAVEMLLELFLSWGHAFRKHDLQTIVPVGPPLGPDNRLTGMFTTGHFLILSQNIDYIQIMTYDYSMGDKQGVAPYDWVERSVETILSRAKEYSGQLMVGINHYGYEYSSKSIQAVNFDKYLDLLKKDESKLEWDAKSKEHYLSTGTSKVYYPSLTSIEMRLNIARTYRTGAAIWDFGQGLNYFSQLL